jgi:hypothetical protein
MTESKPPAALLRQLLDAESAEAAASAVAGNPDWSTGPPPPEVLAALGDPCHSLDGAVVGMARAWERPAMAHALLEALDREGHIERRRRLAWVAKQTPELTVVPELLARAESSDEDAVVRRYLLEAITPLAISHAVPWQTVEKTVRLLARDPLPGVREAAVALAGMGADSLSERHGLLLSAFGDPDDWVVVTAAVMFGHEKFMSIVPAELRQQLLEHSSPRVRGFVHDIVFRRRV